MKYLLVFAQHVKFPRGNPCPWVQIPLRPGIRLIAITSATAGSFVCSQGLTRLMTAFRLTYRYGDLAAPLTISPGDCSNIRYKAHRKNSFTPQERPSLNTSKEKCSPDDCVYREDHVCLIDSLKSSKTTNPHFQNISRWVFFPFVCLFVYLVEVLFG